MRFTGINFIRERSDYELERMYGVEWDVTMSTPDCTRIGSTTLHQRLPIQSGMRRCLLNNAGQVIVYLDDITSLKTNTQLDADLSGASGQVMVEMPEHYECFEKEGNKRRKLLSQFPLQGFYHVGKMYVSAYEATVDRTDVNNPLLSSVVNTTAAFRGGNNNAEWDDTYRDLKGKPATYLSLSVFRNYARNRRVAGKSGKGWNCNLYQVQKTLYWFYVVEYSTLNSQKAYNAALDANGFRQGGLGAGVSTVNSTQWNELYGYYPFVPCGLTNELGNYTGVVAYDVPDSDDGTWRTVSVTSYRGVEHPFGHVWKWTDGVKMLIQSEDDGGKSECYVCYDPDLFTSSGVDGYVKIGELARTNGWVNNILGGEFGDIMPISVGGSSATYLCDYFYTSIPATGVNECGVLFGGSADYGAYDGFVCAYTYYSASLAAAYVGSRLCFIPE